jgi:hypothetical protein
VNQKEKLIAFRLSPNEQFILGTMAAEDGRNISEQLRAIIREAAEKRGLPAVGLIATNEESKGVKNG